MPNGRSRWRAVVVLLGQGRKSQPPMSKQVAHVVLADSHNKKVELIFYRVDLKKEQIDNRGVLLVKAKRSKQI